MKSHRSLVFALVAAVAIAMAVWWFADFSSDKPAHPLRMLDGSSPEAFTPADSIHHGGSPGDGDTDTR